MISWRGTEIVQDSAGDWVWSSVVGGSSNGSKFAGIGDWSNDAGGGKGRRSTEDVVSIQAIRTLDWRARSKNDDRDWRSRRRRMGIGSI
jgi:hypothetical protein